VVDVVLTDEVAQVVVTVTDDGPGVAERDAQRIFEPFYRGARTRAMELPGAGLGLAIARQVARTAGGDVSVGDAQGRGARFVVRLSAHTRS
jgi:two-component system OmpR family sensor kinase